MVATSGKLLSLTAEQKSFFDENGYIHLPGVYVGQELEEMRAHFRDLVVNTDGRPKNVSYDYMEPPANYPPDSFNPKNVAGLMDHILSNDYWFDHFTDPRVVGAIVDVLGPNIDFHNGKVRNKPPGFVSEQNWHQDFPYERHSSPDLAAAITYLEDTEKCAGATEVIAGSHLSGEWPTTNGYLISPDYVDARVPLENQVVASVKAGDVVIIHVLAVHRAGHNFTGTGRHAVINEYKTAETVDEWNNRCAFAGLPLARNGKLVMPRVSAA